MIEYYANMSNNANNLSHFVSLEDLEFALGQLDGGYIIISVESNFKFAPTLDLLRDRHKPKYYFSVTAKKIISKEFCTKGNSIGAVITNNTARYITHQYHINCELKDYKEFRFDFDKKIDAEFCGSTWDAKKNGIPWDQPKLYKKSCEIYKGERQ
jgi:hypothetical protein